MGFFDQFHKDGTAALKPQSLRTKRTVVKPTIKPSQTPTHTSDRVSGILSPKASKPAGAGSNQEPVTKARRARKRVSPAQQRLVSSSDESESEGIEALPRKRAKTERIALKDGTTRRLRSTYDSAKADGNCFDFVHSADIAALGESNNYQAMFKDSSKLEISLVYPGGPQEERYQLVLPRDSEDFNPVNDMIRVIELVSSFYLLPDQAEILLDETSGIIRKLRRALSRGSGQEYRQGVSRYNEIIKSYQNDGTISKNLDAARSLPLPLVERILTQTYARTVSLQVNALKKYENGSDNVYGELLPRFVSKIFRDTNVRSDQVFVDLGSGVGNVVLQAALEVGCESWGCEMMENASELAERQEKEFTARCRLWGLEIGSVNLEKGDFLKNSNIAKVLKSADVVLVNNQAFTPELNNGLMNLFLDLKEGCQIVSLKSFVPPDHKITPRNFNSPVHLLEVEKKEYFSDSVSWTNAPGTYFVARKDSARLKEFLEKMG